MGARRHLAEYMGLPRLAVLFPYPAVKPTSTDRHTSQVAEWTTADSSTTASAQVMFSWS